MAARFVLLGGTAPATRGRRCTPSGLLEIGSRKYRRSEDLCKWRYALDAINRWLRIVARLVGMFGAQGNRMLLKPENRALRALLWFVIIVVPGGFFLLALLAAEAAHRRFREQAALSDPELVEASLSGLTPRN
jgi:hypothetical protein